MMPILLPDLTARLQRRIARLLWRHDRHTFRGHFREMSTQSGLPQIAELMVYDHLVRLLTLADDLLDDILPRIRRQLSFQASHADLDEAPPLRGQIDWGTTLEHSWGEQPDQPPLRFATHVRQRTFVTSENQLVVAILTDYATALGRARTGRLFSDAPITTEEQRELMQLEDRVRRELATTHFQNLTREGDDRDTASLIDLVERRLPPGGSAYRDLIGWWRRLEALHLRTCADQRLWPVLDSQDRAGLLYQLWVALELVEFLSGRQLIGEPQVQVDRLVFPFTWQGRGFQFTYDRQPTDCLAWAGVPGVRPDYFITRADAVDVSYKDRLIWRESGVLLDAKCYLGDSDDRAAEAIKHMLADIQLLDASYGILLLPNIAGLSNHISPRDDRYLGTKTIHGEIRLIELRPMDQIEILQQRLTDVLDVVATWLPERAPIACYGVMQDVDTVNPSGTSIQTCTHCGARLALCPKPHISANRVDLVCPSCDCLQNPRLCHIMGIDQAITLTSPFVRRVLTHDQLVETINQLRDRFRRQIDANDTSDDAEIGRSNLLKAIGELTESYLSHQQLDTTQIEEKLTWVFEAYWSMESHPRGLADDVRNMLISGEFVWNEFQRSTVKDWAACAVQYVRAIERELHRRLYWCCGSPSALQYYGKPMKPHQFTFGTVSIAYERRQNGDQNWQTLLNRAALPSGADLNVFEEVIGIVAQLRVSRNQIAHSERIDQAAAAAIRRVTLGQPGTAGALRRLTEMLDAR